MGVDIGSLPALDLDKRVPKDSNRNMRASSRFCFRLLKRPHKDHFSFSSFRSVTLKLVDARLTLLGWSSAESFDEKLGNIAI